MIYDFAKDQNLLRRAIRNVELDKESEQMQKVKEWYVKLELMSHPATNSQPSSTSTAVATGLVENNITKPIKKRNVKKQSHN